MPLAPAPSYEADHLTDSEHRYHVAFHDTERFVVATTSTFIGAALRDGTVISCEGRAQKEDPDHQPRLVARTMDLGPATVKRHSEDSYARLGVGDRAYAVAQAMRLGLIT